MTTGELRAGLSRNRPAARRPSDAGFGSPVVRAEQVTKLYGHAVGVRDLEFAVDAGEVFGFLGPNGSGKTTTIRLLLDLIRPSSGRVSVFGRDSRREGVEIRREVGYVPGDLTLYGRLTAREHLQYFAHLRGLAGLGAGEHVARRLELDLDRPVRTLSRGNRQKVALAQAFMHRPRLLVLDEPTSGLDPLVQQVFYDLVREASAEGRTVFLSSHVLSDVQRVADRVALVRAGRLLLLDAVESLRARTAPRVQATFFAEPPIEAFAGIPGVREIERRSDAVTFALDGPADPLVKALAAYRVSRLDSREADLEDVFLDLYRGDGRAA